MRGSSGDVSLLARILPFDSLDGQLATGSQTHVGSEGRVGLPSWRLAWRASLLHHAVDLLEGETLGLPDEEVGVQEAEDTGRAPDEEDPGTEVLVVSGEIGFDDSSGRKEMTYSLVNTNHVWRNDGDDTVPEPVRRSRAAVVSTSLERYKLKAVMKGSAFGKKMMIELLPRIPLRKARIDGSEQHSQSNTSRTDWDREDLADDDPSSWTPGGGKEEDVDTDQGDLSSYDIGVGTVGDTDDGANELADQHTKGTPNKERSSTESLNGPEGDWGGADVDEGGDQGNEEWVGDCAEGLEEGRSEVEDEVYTSPLLHHLCHC